MPSAENRPHIAPQITMTPPLEATTERDALLQRYRDVRSTTLSLCEGLEAEDMLVQSMPDVSPTKWHLAHVSWFFEAMLLSTELPGYRPLNERYHHLFNSYYQSLGDPYPRSKRGLLSRPTAKEVLEYREHVDNAMHDLLAKASPELLESLIPRLELGLQHEQQHQELLLMDIKHVFATNPLRTAYREQSAKRTSEPTPMNWLAFDGGDVLVGADGIGFSYDNEQPRHRVSLEPFEIASRPVNAGEYLAFIEDGGYRDSRHWLSDGWDLVCGEQWSAPLYWEQAGSDWHVMTLAGMRALDPHETLCHLSYYEADAYATWAGCRLPNEYEWERAAGTEKLSGNFLESQILHPLAPKSSVDKSGLRQIFGDVWEWTSSPYAGYPGYKPFSGALAEYNGKFMINQLVLRGGSCVTPQAHLRRSYRNFYYPSQRWMFSGLRLAR